MSTLITGIAGQDGRLLANRLSKIEPDLYGICKPGQMALVEQFCPEVKVIELNLIYEEQILEILNKIKPTQIYNLAGFSSVSASWTEPTLATRVNSIVPSIILKWCLEFQPSTRFVQASSSEIFGGTNLSPQNEMTPLSPITPYGLSKGFAHKLVQQFRTQYGLFASNAVLYNHESPLRGDNFVTRKITKAVAAIFMGSDKTLNLGDIKSKRDWGWAPDYVVGLQSIMKNNTPGDFILATGKTHTVEDLLKFAFNRIGAGDFKSHVSHDLQSDRAVDPFNLVGDYTLARTALDWKPSLDLREIIEIMVDFDIELLRNPTAQWSPSNLESKT